MSENKHINFNSDDEEDLELLRLAALKSRNASKDLSPNETKTKIDIIGTTNSKIEKANKMIITNQEPIYSNMSYTPSLQQNKMPSQLYQINPEMNGIRVNSNQTYYSPSKQYHQLPINRVGGFVSQVPQYIPPINQSILHQSPTMTNLPRPSGPVRHWLPPSEPTQPTNLMYNANGGMGFGNNQIMKDTQIGDVQLSPRSLAFVAQNNGILARRKIEADLSPKNKRYRSKSPNFSSLYKYSPLPSPTSSPCYRTTNSPTWLTLFSPPYPSRNKRISKSKSKTPSRRIRRSRSSSGSGHIRQINDRRRRSISRNYDSNTKRYLSRSPPPSKLISNSIKRNKSRSPLPRRYSPRSNIPHRHLSRSRSPRRPSFEKRRSRSPLAIKRRISPTQNRRDQRKPERKSPIKIKRKSPSLRDTSRRDSPPTINFSRKHVRKSLSPQLRKRSRSPRSPSNLSNTKYVRNSRDLISNSENQTQVYSTNMRKKSPSLNVSKSRNNEGINNNNNNNSNNYNNNTRNDNKKNNSNNSNNCKNDENINNNANMRSKSPPSLRNKSKSKTPEKIARKEETTNDEHEQKSNRNLANKYCTTIEEQTNIKCQTIMSLEVTEKSVQKICKEKSTLNIESKTPPLAEDQLESLTPPLEKDMDDVNFIQQIDAVLGDTKMNKSNISSDEDDDGIDLFASEESESENEGRFKSTHKCERSSNVPSMSFSKLKESSNTSTNVRNLHDIVNDSKYDDNKSRRDYFKKYTRNNKTDNKRRGDDFSSSRRRSRSTSVDKNKYSESYEKSTKFKSTFQTIKNEGSRVLSKSSPKNSVRSTPERNIKKRSKDNISSELQDRTISLENRIIPPYLLDQLKRKKVQNSSKTEKKIEGKSAKEIDRSKSSTNTKKSIHSRLGAMTNTFKSSTKTTRNISSQYNDQV